MIEDLGPLREVADPMERAKRAGTTYDRLTALGREATRIRREAIEELLQGGMSQAQVGAALRLSRGRISQLVSSGPAPERLFLGDDTLTVAIGGKLEADKPDPGSVLAQEDFRTFERLQDLVRPLQLEAEAEVIPPPGMLRLNRDNLVVICGPRLSPLLSQILESDPILGFDKDENGWYLFDRKTSTTYRSPMDAGKSSDIAYFGRLPRPDGRGTFLYIAGIHAAGPGAVIHFLATHLGEFYKEAHLKRFSTLIEGEFDANTRRAISSRRITPLYIHGGR